MINVINRIVSHLETVKVKTIQKVLSEFFLKSTAHLVNIRRLFFIGGECYHKMG